ncbi:MAG: ZIP family metal transporter [Candidatus Omnitrophota bacterium]|nr:ZIP family metal transporter [Candidatus Omnitrophota bacterium]
MNVWIYSIASVVLVGLISLIGVFTLSLKKEWLQKMTLFLVSFAVGGLLGDVFIHLLPEVFESLGIRLATSLYIMAGMLIFFVLEKFIRWRHCHVPTSQNHMHPVVALNLIGDGVHNLVDGMIIGASFSVSIPIGVATTLAVIMHEIPQEIGDFGVLIHGGLSIKKALWFNFVSALSAIVGVLISLLVGKYMKDYTLILMPMTAGGFLYIAGSDLIPELHQSCGIKISHALGQFVAIILGVSVMALLLFLE